MKKILLLSFIAVLFSGCTCGVQGVLDNITPRPREITPEKGCFNIKGTQFKYDSTLEERTVKAIRDLACDIGAASGKTCKSSAVDAAAISGKGVFFLKDASLEAENYRIAVSSRGIRVSAPDHNGFYYAIQTLRQILPVGNYNGEGGGKWLVPCAVISDGPRFAYRGMHLDCCRHIWSIEETKKYLDVMAMYKLNRLHWHLTEDQGWRMEVSKYPLLTTISAYRNGTMEGHDWDSNDGIRYGGYYTREQMKEIVDYAWERGITVIPEIDLPGHMVAALAAYPWLGCDGGPYEVWTRWGISEDVLCIGKETTFKFLEDVLSELCEIFPSEYIHIGGDECPKVRWEKCPLCQARIRSLGLVSDEKGTKEQKLQNYVTARIQKFLEGKGRKIIGWDEILEGELEPGATVMSWRGASGGIEAANRGFDVIMTPNSHMYFDYFQSKGGEKDGEPLGIGGFLPLEKVYSFDPYDQIEPDMQSHILGVQANLWTEYIATPEHLEYMLLPRMLALSEVQWCTPENRDYERFSADLESHQYSILSLLGYSFRK